MTRALLVVNAGSSSVKYALYREDLGCELRGHEEGSDVGSALGSVLGRIEADARFEIVAAGHRVVHGGDLYSAPVRVDDAVVARLEALGPLAPLHQPYGLAGIRTVARRHPGLPQVACFDTAFHQTQPRIARLFPLTAALEAEGVKRYGFHGLSYEYVAGKLGAGYARVIVAHLGNGASLCALRDGRSIASTMGFTALDGLMMGTRSGAIDPGVVLYLMEQKGWSAREVARLLYRESGLLGISGISNDMRTLLASVQPRAKLAVELFVYRIVREIGSLAAALGGLDALVFTGGIGEHAAPVREAVRKAIAWMGDVAVRVVPTNEEEMIARHTAAILAGALAAVT